MVPHQPEFDDLPTLPPRATGSSARTRRLLLAVWLVAVSSLVVVGVSWQIAGALDGRGVELGVFLLWLSCLYLGPRYLDGRDP